MDKLNKWSFSSKRLGFMGFCALKQPYISVSLEIYFLEIYFLDMASTIALSNDLLSGDVIDEKPR